MIQKKITYLIIGIFIALVFHAMFRRADRISGDNNDRIIIDTLYVDRIIKVPERVEVFKDSTPEPKIVYKENKELLEQYTSLTDENEKLKKYIEAITMRTYEKKYVSKDSVVTVTVKDSVTGTLNFQSVIFKLAQQEIVFKEKIINRTIEKKPNFSLSLGVGLRIPHALRGSGSPKVDNYPLPSDPISFEGVVGVKDKKGYGYQLGIDTQGGARFTITKDLFIKY